MLGRLILTTVGTSALDRAKLESLRIWNAYLELKRDLRRLPSGKLHDWVNNNFTFSKAAAFIEAYVKEILRYDIADEARKPAEGRINIFSAELTSLHLMYEDPNLDLNPERDSIIFLLSESPEGVLAGMINQRLMVDPEGGYLQGRCLTPQLTLVPGLQVDNFRQFFSEGLPAFVNCIREAARAFPTKEPLLNLTGGFKALAVYSAYFALAFEIPMVFVFEELTDVVKIQSATVNFSPEQREQLIRGIREVIAVNTRLAPDAFNLMPA